MDQLLGGIIDDYVLYKIIEGIIAILSIVTVYLGIQIALTLKYIKNKSENPEDIVSQKKSFNRSAVFIFITGFFLLIHEFFEGLEKEAPDYTTYELFELIAIAGLVLFFYEWYKMLNKFKNKPLR